MKYKVGDKVRIRADLKRRVNYYMEDKSEWDKACLPMLELAGKVMTIVSANYRGYRLKEDSKSWNWVDEMFEGLVQRDSMNIVIECKGNKITARYGDLKATARCSPEDNFDFNTGAKLAFERLIDNLFKIEEKEECKYCKYKVGQKYRFLGFMFAPSGVIEITKINGDRVSYKILEGLGNDPGGDFQIGSIFCDRCELIEEKSKYYNGKVVCVEKDESFAYTVGKIYEFKDGKVEIDNGHIVPVVSSITNLSEWNNNPNYHCEFVALKE